MKDWSDEKLYSAARNYGKNALFWRAKFIGLLPEVDQRNLWEKKNFESIFVFAKKLAGLSEGQVRRVLNLERRFENYPCLRNLLINGELSVNKLARVASIATLENEEELAGRVKLLSKRAIEVFVRDQKSVPGHTCARQTFELSDEVQDRLLKIKAKGLDVNEVLLELLDRREKEISEEKEVIVKNLKLTHSRYIPAKIRRIVRKEHGSVCSIPNCSKPSAHLHHSQLFSLSKIHDPRYLAPLCKEHHEIAHTINLKVQKHRSAIRE
jgi:predicted CopG family antitoxin